MATLRKLRRRSSISLAIAMLLLIAGMALGVMGYETVSKVLGYSFIPVFLVAYFQGFKFVVKGNRKAWAWYKNKKDIFTDSFLDDDDDDSKKPGKAL